MIDDLIRLEVEIIDGIWLKDPLKIIELGAFIVILNPACP